MQQKQAVQKNLGEANVITVEQSAHEFKLSENSSLNSVNDKLDFWLFFGFFATGSSSFEL